MPSTTPLAKCSPSWELRNAASGSQPPPQPVFAPVPEKLLTIDVKALHPSPDGFAAAHGFPAPLAPETSRGGIAPCTAILYCGQRDTGRDVATQTHLICVY